MRINGIEYNVDDWLEEMIVREYDWSIDRIPNIQEFKQEMDRALTLWTLQIYKPLIEGRLEKLYVEQPLYMPLGEWTGNSAELPLPIWLFGTPDIIQESYAMRDWKTVRSTYGWSQSRADYSIQASLYLGMWEANTGEMLPDFYFHVYDRSDKDWSTFSTDRDPDVIRAAQFTALQYGRQLAAGIFPATMVGEDRNGRKKRAWYCSTAYCPAWNVCEHKFLKDGTDTSKRAERKW